MRPTLARRIAADFLDAGAAGRALIAAADGRLRFGVPFPYSMHAELLHYWMESLGEPAIEVHTVPPSRMAGAIAAGEIDAFCVGEPWGSVAVERGAAELILPGAAIWRFAPEKVLAARRVSQTRLELVLAAGAEQRGRELAARENACCSYFVFGFADAGETVLMSVEVPADQVRVLDGLQSRVDAATDSGARWGGRGT